MFFARVNDLFARVKEPDNCIHVNCVTSANKLLALVSNGFARVNTLLAIVCNAFANANVESGMGQGPGCCLRVGRLVTMVIPREKASHRARLFLFLS
jgi:hypothetical protein